MKHFYFFIAGLLIISTMSFSQKSEFVISLQGKKIITIPSFSKNKNVLIFDSKNKNEIEIQDDSDAPDQKRTWNQTPA